MIVGTVKEIKIGENRVGLTPHGAKALVDAGHEVLVESGAGKNSGFSDTEYGQAGAKILKTAKDVYEKAGMIIKVKEPQKSEFEFLRENQILFTYLHLAAEPEVTKMLLERKITSIAYETVELSDGTLPLLTPMSEVAGCMAAQIGAHYLEKTYGGFGKLLGGVTGVKPSKVVVLGSGIVGTNAAKIAFGMGADVTVIGRNEKQLKGIEKAYNGKVKTLMSNPSNIEKSVAEADLLVGAVYITGAKAPKLVTRAMVKKMKPGSVIVDVAIDQGGCMETSRPTSHQNPIYVEENVIHYCVTNMPGAVPHTSTFALTNATLPYALKIANDFEKAVGDEALRKGVNTYKGRLTDKDVADALGLKHEPLDS